MRKILATALLLSAAAFAQDVQRTFHFASISTHEEYRDIGNGFRMIVELKDVSVDETARTLSTHGTADQIALADWLFPQLDVAGTPAPVSHEYQTTGLNPVVRVFYFAHAPSARAAQEIVNVVRTGADVQRVTVAWESRTMAVRSTREQIAATAWMFSQLDVAAPSPGAPMQSFRLDGDPRSPEMRIVHPAHTSQPAGIQELVNAIRTVADINRVFPVQTAGIIMMRGSADYIATAEWVLSQLDVAENQQGPAPHQQAVTAPYDPMTRVFYLSHTASPEATQQIVNAVRTTAKVARVYPNMQARAVVLRGTPQQVTQAAGIIAEMDR
jgi:hypothetical protein